MPKGLKYSVVILFCLIFCGKMFAQELKSLGFWTSEIGEIFILDSTENNTSLIRGDCGFEKEYLLYYRNGDTISLQDRYYNISVDSDKLLVDRYDFLVLEETNDLLQVRPLTELAKNYMGEKELIEFRPFLFGLDLDGFNFEELEVIYSGYHLKINSNRKLFLERRSNGNTGYYTLSEAERRKFGKFEGTIEKDDYEELLLNLLGTGFLKGEDLNNFRACSICYGTTFTIKVNGKIWKYEYDMINKIMIPFQTTLGRITENENLKRIK